MSASRFLFRNGLLSRIARRTFATEVAISGAPKFEPYSPVEVERNDIAESLLEKAKKPWTELSKDDKIAIYRASFPYTIESMAQQESHTKEIVGAVSILLAISLTFFLFLRKYVSAEAPSTINEEWEKATVEKLKKNRANPITGVSSQ
ncbi:cytochrome c oxidase subunit 4 isoform 2, mitochondrial-like [Dendronephthya gigantea]|uniref:cytochrome c oxidase subunit 4 isoform 2, mitochondrial-like n=1 Tax=Dendronephthya gigantea TaxID=151771 RepID=UPI00106AEA76|nr:cytochrome c oxidase subunit 4 isoform 2, mitochondrial-like [Dendronephthya gigantea]